jgi:aminomethyltransferase
MCLYGNDLDEDTSPVEAGLTWVIGMFYHYCTSWSRLTVSTFQGKERKENGTFIGAEGVRQHLKDGPPRRRVGMVVEGAPARRKYFLSFGLEIDPLNLFFPFFFLQRVPKFSIHPQRSC